MSKKRGKLRKRYNRVAYPILRSPFIIESNRLLSFRRAVIIPQLHGEDYDIDTPIEKLNKLWLQ